MKILVVGDFSSIHVYNFIRNVIKHVDCECVGYHIIPDAIMPEYQCYYSANNINVTKGVDPSIYSEKGAITFVKQSISLLSSLGEFDVLHVHAVRPFITLPIYLVRKRFKKIILTYWGSDLFRTSKLHLLVTAPLLSCANIIHVLTHEMLAYFEALPWPISRNSKKVRVFDFGNMFFEKIDCYLPDRNKIKAEFDLDPNKIVCTIGYVGRPQMQQIKTVESILPLITKKKDKIQLAIPAYGISESDFDKLNYLLNNSGIKYGIYSEFMDPDRVSKFRAITDIFIHAQTTDALSCSVVEHFYSGSVVINGGWLKYENLDNNGAYYHKFDTFSSLAEILKSILSNLYEEKDKSKVNIDIVKGLIHWDVLRPQWLKMYIENE